MLNKNNRVKFRNSIARKFILYILIFSSTITLLLTALQLYLDYNRDIDLIEQRFEQVETSYLQSMQDTLWVSNFELLRTQLEGLSQLPDIEFLEVTLEDKQLLAVGEMRSKEIMQRLFPLTYTYRDKIVNLGKLHIVVSLDNVYQRLFDKAVIILITQSFKTFLVSLFIFVIFYSLVGRHLNTIADYGKSLSLDYHTTPVKLQRPSTNTYEQDELAQLQYAINQMRDNLYCSFNQVKESNTQLQSEIDQHKVAEQQIVTLNTQLEATIKQRTQSLENTNIELENSLKTLRTTQQQLVVQEKLASMGSLVSGVAHELNTPIGVAITAASSLKERNQDLMGKIAENKLNKNEFNRYLELSNQATELIHINLDTASNLVTSFKRLSSDQAPEQIQRIDLANYLEYIFKGLKQHLITAKHKYEIELAHTIQLNTYPGALAKVVNNLVMNSIIHGFDGTKAGTIIIRAKVSDKMLHMTYLDNGKGINEEQKSKIFDPFYTTTRGKGGTGLGLHVIHNLVTLNLGGTISLSENSINEQSKQAGIKFNISLPIDISRSTNTRL